MKSTSYLESIISKIKQCLASKWNWTAITSITAILALLFSGYQFHKSVCISKRQLEIVNQQFIHQREQDSIQNIYLKSLQRPNFFAQIAIVPFDLKNPEFSIEYLFNNFGPMAASDFDARIYVIPSDLSFNTQAHVTSVSEITPSYSLSSKGKVANFTPYINQIPVYFYVSINYKDKIFHEIYHQDFYFIWQGIKNGDYSNACENLQFHDKEILINYIQLKGLK